MACNCGRSKAPMVGRVLPASPAAARAVTAASTPTGWVVTCADGGRSEPMASLLLARRAAKACGGKVGSG